MFQRLVIRRKVGAGVRHRFVEKELEEIVVQVVVLGNVLPASPDVVCPEFVRDPVEHLEEIARNEFFPGT